jgi:hypothetical protein
MVIKTKYQPYEMNSNFLLILNNRLANKNKTNHNKEILLITGKF